ncbi:MAG: DUF2905 domain-containing protein [Candidatus Omnitrophota bacterium]
MDTGKAFILVGAGLILLGIFLCFSGKIPWIGKLPGDIIIKKENFTFYFPLATSILISIVLSVFLFLWNRK